MNAATRKIDVHHHVLPPEFISDLTRRQGPGWTGGPPVPKWTPEIGLEVMARNGIATAMASVVPEPWWGDNDAARKWARHSNEYLARVVQDDSEHWGGLATLPLPDVAAAVRELEYAYDTLRMDGVILFASTDKQYLGDPAWDELYQELDRRKAAVLIHPSMKPPGSIVPRISVPWGLVEFPFDTTRAAANLLFTGTLERYPDIRWILSHAGGAIPYLAGRISLGEQIKGATERAPKGVLSYLKNLYYDTALSATEPQLAAVKEFVPEGHLLFGSDYPMVPENVVVWETKGMESTRILDDAQKQAVYRDNAIALFPRLAGG